MTTDAQSLGTKEIIDRIFKEPGIRYELTEFGSLGKPIHEIISIYRAVRQVRERARSTGTALAYVQDGRLKIEPPSDGSDQESTMDAGR